MPRVSRGSRPGTVVVITSVVCAQSPHEPTSTSIPLTCLGAWNAGTVIEGGPLEPGFGLSGGHSDLLNSVIQTGTDRRESGGLRSGCRRLLNVGYSPPVSCTKTAEPAERPHSAPAGSQVVGIPGLQARPLGGGTSIGTEILLAFKPLWPAGRRVLPRLLPPIDGQVQQPIAVIHRLDAATCRPVSLEDIGCLSQIANDVHPAHPASTQESVERVLGRLPSLVPQVRPSLGLTWDHCGTNNEYRWFSWRDHTPKNRPFAKLKASLGSCCPSAPESANLQFDCR